MQPATQLRRAVHPQSFVGFEQFAKPVVPRLWHLVVRGGESAYSELQHVHREALEGAGSHLNGLSFGFSTFHRQLVIIVRVRFVHHAHGRVGALGPHMHLRLRSLRLRCSLALDDAQRGGATRRVGCWALLLSLATCRELGFQQVLNHRLQTAEILKAFLPRLLERLRHTRLARRLKADDDTLARLSRLLYKVHDGGHLDRHAELLEEALVRPPEL
mmetsp:Transcript_25104/g.50459  ORF Transcript_25104/g.50459 Transcript_25104/m.50459 type:complete len:216 (+) Transcript_25104:399-1046(+)